MQTRRNALPITAELAKDEENKTVLLLPMLSNLHMTDYRLKREQNNLIGSNFTNCLCHFVISWQRQYLMTASFGIAKTVGKVFFFLI